ncbi:ASCH domain-containing protein [Microbulbifer pacificus]|uniref:ASCH domain-containing protein n=1 Tax=Microbulbifer pacificus TaxID=407164 RepID=A0AAU0N0J0_9GAMM|nr:ASCH domain-containing protein [Microbulbifer pacificus]WOX05955.1 ASCH domain-containing protein [Microbulbifer pacificus]
MPEISKALIVDEPWITYLLQGKKAWELRSRKTQYRGWLGLIKKGSGQVVGIARLTGVSEYLNDAELERSLDKHQVGPEVYKRADYKWRFAWKLEDIRALNQPVSYHHKSGAVTWVTLNPEAQVLLKLACGELAISWEHPETSQEKPVNAIGATRVEFEKESVSDRSAGWEGTAGILMKTTNHQNSSSPDGGAERRKVNGVGLGISYVPIARDGSRFLPEVCNGKGHYTVGDKGDEKQFSDYEAALKYLRDMPKAKWRRPNSAGNWGIVSAIDWVKN